MPDSGTLRRAGGALIVCALTASHAAVAQQIEETALAPPGSAFERMTVVGSREDARLTGGAANVVTPEDIAQYNHSDVLRVLRQVPGVYIVEEEGLGLRPNIGIRGSGMDRNSRITVMEDGVLIAPAPYSAAAAYYFPTMQRMSAVEVRKGSASVRSGPRTTGGAINLISTPIPEAGLSGHANVMFGEDSTALGHGWVGGSNDNWGFLVEGIRQQTDGFKDLDGGGDTGYDLDDYRAKLRFSTDRGDGLYQQFELKLGRTEQQSDETYMGLTSADFRDDPYRRYAASQLDNIETQHDQRELRHFIEITPTLDITTALYSNDFKRNWYKNEQVNGLGLGTVLDDPFTYAAEYAWLTGSDSPDDALTIRNNNRAYESEGIQSIVAWSPAATGSVSHSFELGIRYHEDEEDRFQDNDRYRMEAGRLVRTTDGAPGTHDNRVGSAEALAIYLQNELRFGSWIVTPGVRWEQIDLEQRRWALGDADRSQGITARATDTVTEVIPGLSAVYLVDDNWSLLGGVHKGFNPPGPGSSADPEESINYEAGVRYAADRMTGEAIAFFNDYDNLVGTCTVSTGANCNVGDQFDGGEVRMYGLELAGAYEHQLANGLRAPLRIAYTFTDAEFRTGFESGFDEWGDVSRGDELPYLPEHQLQLGAGLGHDRWDVNLSASWVDETRITAGQGGIPSGFGTDSRWILDLAGNYAVTGNISLFARIENLLDEEYVAARRPAGLRPGRPQTALAGFIVNF